MSKTPLFLQLIRSPGHLSFVAANVTLLVHLQLLSTLRLLKHKEKHQLKISELQNFFDSVNNLDSQIAHIQSQISELKSRKKRLKQRDVPRNETSAVEYTTDDFMHSDLTTGGDLTSNRNRSGAKRTENGRNEKNKVDYHKLESPQPIEYQDGLLSPQLMARRLREENYAKGQIRLARKFTKEREAFKTLANLPDILAKLFPESADTASKSLTDFSAESMQSSDTAQNHPRTVFKDP